MICLFFCLLGYCRSYEGILMKFFLAGLGHGGRTNLLDFGGDPDHDCNSFRQPSN